MHPQNQKAPEHLSLFSVVGQHPEAVFSPKHLSTHHTDVPPIQLNKNLFLKGKESFIHPL